VELGPREVLLELPVLDVDDVVGALALVVEVAALASAAPPATIAPATLSAATSRMILLCIRTSLWCRVSSEDALRKLERRRKLLTVGGEGGWRIGARRSQLKAGGMAAFGCA
jgi:hypothetical protein